MTHDFEPQGHVVLDSSDISRALTRLSHEILSALRVPAINFDGIPTRGASLATRLGDKISAIQGSPVSVGAIDITMYRDDLRSDQLALTSNHDPT